MCKKKIEPYQLFFFLKNVAPIFFGISKQTDLVSMTIFKSQILYLCRKIKDT